MLQSTLVPGSGSTVPAGDGGVEDRFSDGSIGVHQHDLWQVEFLQLPQEVDPLLYKQDLA